jgi:hypothetical protein
VREPCDGAHSTELVGELEQYEDSYLAEQFS